MARRPVDVSTRRSPREKQPLNWSQQTGERPMRLVAALGFACAWPLRRRSSAGKTAAERRPRSRILIADDDASLRAVLAEALSTAEIRLARLGRVALTLHMDGEP